MYCAILVLYSPVTPKSILKKKNVQQNQCHALKQDLVKASNLSSVTRKYMGFVCALKIVIKILDMLSYKITAN